MKYKGSTVQYQRIKIKKGAKIQDVTPEMSQEEREKMEARGLEEQKMREALAEKTPTWRLYSYMGDVDICQESYWMDMIKRQFDDAAGDDTDRWKYLTESFRVDQTLDVMEEYDGMNHEAANYLIFQADLPMLVRGHAI